MAQRSCFDALIYWIETMIYQRGVMIGTILLVVVILLIAASGYFPAKLRERKNRERQRNVIRETLLQAQESNELFDVQFLDVDSSIYNVSGILVALDEDVMRLEVLHHVPGDLKDTDLDVYFRIPIPSGYSMFKFKSRLLGLHVEKDRSELILPYPQILDVGQPRKFLRVTPPDDAVQTISIWPIDGMLLPRDQHDIHESMMSSTLYPIIRLENISASGMAVRFPGATPGELPYFFLEGSLLLVRIVYTMPGDRRKVGFWGSCRITELRNDSDRPYLIAGMQLTDWAIEEPDTTSLSWFPVTPETGATPIIQWVTKMDIEQYRYYWGDMVRRRIA